MSEQFDPTTIAADPAVDIENTAVEGGDTTGTVTADADDEASETFRRLQVLEYVDGIVGLTSSSNHDVVVAGGGDHEDGDDDVKSTPTGTIFGQQAEPQQDEKEQANLATSGRTSTF